MFQQSSSQRVRIVGSMFVTRVRVEELVNLLLRLQMMCASLSYGQPGPAPESPIGSKHERTEQAETTFPSPRTHSTSRTCQKFAVQSIFIVTRRKLRKPLNATRCVRLRSFSLVLGPKQFCHADMLGSIDPESRAVVHVRAFFERPFKV